jgi:hypothetical protein
MSDVAIPDYINYTRTILLLIFIVILFVGSTYLMIKARKIELNSAKRILQGYALFGFCFAFTRIFFLFSAYYTGIGEGYSSAIWTVSAYAVTMASIVFIFIVVERYILVKKPIFASIAFISLCVDLLALFFTIFNISLGTLASKDIALFVQNIIAPILGLAICVLYLVIIRSAAGTVRSKAIKTFIGVFLLLMGVLLDSALFSSIDAFTVIRAVLTPACFIIGVLIVFMSIK